MTMRELQVWLEDQLNEIKKTQVAIQVTLAEQAKDVEHHIKRTDLLEERVEQVAQDLKPVKEHVIQLKGIAKFIALVALVLGIVVSVSKIID